MSQNSITTLIKFLSLFVSEIVTIDKNRDGNVTAFEIIGAALVILGKSQELAYVFNNIGEDFKTIYNTLDNDDDAFDKLVDEIIALDFLPDDRKALEDALKKTLMALMYLYDAGLSWATLGVAKTPDVDVKTALKIS